MHSARSSLDGRHDTQGVMLRQATEADIRAFLGGVPASMRAIVAEKDGRVLGIAALCHTALGRVAISEMNEELTRHPRVIVRAMRILREMAQDSNGPVYAIKGRATCVLEHIGFIRQPNGVYRWNPHPVRTEAVT